MITRIVRYDHPAMESEELTITSVGLYEKMNPCLVDRPRGLGDYLLMLFHSPVTLGLPDGSFVDRKPTSVILWEPGQDHLYGNLDMTWNHSWMHFHGPAAGELAGNYRQEPGEPLALSDPAPAEKSLIHIYDELSQLKSSHPRICQNLTENLFLRLDRELEDPPLSPVPSSLLLLKRELMENPARPRRLGEMASSAGYSVPHFCALWKRHFSASPVDYLIGLRMSRAAYLLKNRALRVTQVAEQVGYDDVYYFSKLFKKRFGISPGHFNRP